MTLRHVTSTLRGSLRRTRIVCAVVLVVHYPAVGGGGRRYGAAIAELVAVARQGHDHLIVA